MANTTDNTPLRRYIITGAAGHLGSTILRELNGTEAEVYGLLLPGEAPKITGPNITYFTGDILNIDSLRCLFERGENRELYVIHTAALISIAAKVSPNLRRVNVDGVGNILRVCEEYHEHGIFFALYRNFTNFFKTDFFVSIKDAMCNF